MQAVHDITSSVHIYLAHHMCTHEHMHRQSKGQICMQIHRQFHMYMCMRLLHIVFIGQRMYIKQCECKQKCDRK